MKLGVNLIIAVILKAPSSNGGTIKGIKDIIKKKIIVTQITYIQKHSLLYRCGACVPEVIVMSCFKMKIMFPHSLVCWERILLCRRYVRLRPSYFTRSICLIFWLSIKVLRILSRSSRGSPILVELSSESIAFNFQ